MTEELPWNTIRCSGYIIMYEHSPHSAPQLEKLDSEKGSWCACGHTKENTLTVPCLPGHQYRSDYSLDISYHLFSDVYDIYCRVMSRFRVTAVNRIGDSEPLTSELIAVAKGVDSLVR